MMESDAATQVGCSSFVPSLAGPRRARDPGPGSLNVVPPVARRGPRPGQVERCAAGGASFQAVFRAREISRRKRSPDRSVPAGPRSVWWTSPPSKKRSGGPGSPIERAKAVSGAMKSSSNASSVRKCTRGNWYLRFRRSSSALRIGRTTRRLTSLWEYQRGRCRVRCRCRSASPCRVRAVLEAI